MSAAILFFSGTWTFGNSQTSIMQELAAKGKTVPGKEDVKRNHYDTEKSFDRVHDESKFDVYLHSGIILIEGKR